MKEQEKEQEEREDPGGGAEGEGARWGSSRRCNAEFYNVLFGGWGISHLKEPWAIHTDYRPQHERERERERESRVERDR